jgi:hypothetical protein
MKTLSRSTFSMIITVVVGLMLMALPVFADGTDAAIAVINAAGSAGLLGTAGVYFGYALTAVGAASFLLQGIALITGVTPSKRDDEFVNQGFRAIAKLQGLLDRIALNPTSEKARRR